MKGFKIICKNCGNENCEVICRIGSGCVEYATAPDIKQIYCPICSQSYDPEEDIFIAGERIK